MATSTNLIPDDKALRREIVKAAKAQRWRVSDGGGLYVLAVKGGDTWAWRLDYSFGGKRKTLSLGLLDVVSLTEARKKRRDALALLEAGTDPSAARKATREQKVVEVATVRAIAKGEPLPGSFRELFEDWIQTKSPKWSPSYAERIRSRMSLHVMGALGDRPVNSIDTPEVVKLARAIQAGRPNDFGEAVKTVDTAHAAIQHVSAVFRHGMTLGVCVRNPAAGVTEVLDEVQVTHMAARVKPDEFAALLRSIAGYDGSILTRGALMMAAMTFQRPLNIRAMEWADIDFANAVWTIPSDKMKRPLKEKKNGEPHVVYLAPEALAILREVQPLTGGTGYVFGTALRSKNRPMSENTLNAALRRMGYDKTQATAHGFRASARTLLRERLGVDMEVIEEQQAHKKSGPLGGAYDRAEYLEQRVEMLKMWGRVVADCAAGKPFPVSGATKPATRPAKASMSLTAGGDIDVKSLTKLFEKLTGQKVKAADLKRAAAELTQANRADH